MAETRLHPRPDFATFLQSDANGLRDSVTYYERQRALRFQKVALLQKKKENAYVPGYKKRPATVPTPMTIAERAEKIVRPKSAIQNVTINPTPVDIEPQSKHLGDCHGNNISQVFTASSAKIGLPNVSFNRGDSNAESGIKPIIVNKQRNIKSATTRQGERIEEDNAILNKRPATVPEEIGRNTSQNEVKGIDLPGVVPPILKKTDTKTLTSTAHEVSDIEADKLYKAYQWGTTTQRSYGDAGWEERMDKKVKDQPKAGFRNLPDPVTYRLTYRRYNSEPGYWQSFGSNWDYIQPRRGDTYPKGPQSIIYQSTHSVMQQIPGYSGYSSTLANYEFDQSFIPPQSAVRTVQPRYTDISRKANIPGYKGCVHWSNANRAHAKMSFPEPTTSARIHREIPLEDEVSPFRRDGILSRMVTTVPPNNPFRKIVY